MTDSLSKMISSLNNASAARLATFTLEASQLSLRLLDVLKKGGYIRGYHYHTPLDRHRKVTILLKYTEQGNAIRELKRISSSGKRIYLSASKIKPSLNGFGNLILSTSRGLLYDFEAKFLGVGGEVLCSIR